MKAAGLYRGTRSVPKDDMYWTQDVYGQEMIARKSDGALLTRLGKGDMVFTNEMTKSLYDFAKNPEGFMKFDPPTLHDVGTTINVGDSDIDITFNVPNVTNADDFMRTLQRSKKFEQLVQSMTIGRINGKGTVGKFNVKI